MKFIANLVLVVWVCGITYAAIGLVVCAASLANWLWGIYPPIAMVFGGACVAFTPHAVVKLIDWAKEQI